jgi:hypothetical protein
MAGLALLPPLVGGILLLACIGKARSLGSGGQQVDGLFALLPHGLALALTWVVVATEAVLGTLLWVQSGPIPRVATVLFSAGLVAFVLLLVRRRPDAGCGCGGQSKRPVSRRNVVRAVALLVLASVAMFAPATPWTMRSVTTSALVASFAAAGYFWLGRAPSRAHRPDCATEDVPEARTISHLHRSATFKQAADQYELSEPPDVWREGCWRFVAYEGRGDRVWVDLVFALYLGSPQRPIRVAVLEKDLV